MAESVEGHPWGRIALVSCPAILLLGWVSGWVSNSGFGNPWFDALKKPFFMPPGWAFGAAWTILYVLMGIAVAMVLALPPSPRRRLALILFFIQLAMNLAWSPLFFGLHQISAAKYLIFVMTVVAAAAAGQFYRLKSPAGLILVPYLAWLIFATVLNSTIGTLNPG